MKLQSPSACHGLDESSAFALQPVPRLLHSLLPGGTKEAAHLD